MSTTKTIKLDVGTTIDDRYRVTGRIGEGGMGTVYESEQIALGRSVALKVLRPEYAEKETATKRFQREAKAASSIDHRNVVKILDFGRLPTGELYYTMERLNGRDLSQVLGEGGALSWSRASWVILQVVRAFGAIHAQGIVHRDIKPANCFVMDPKAGDEPDFVKILDFGIANLQEDRTKATALTGAADIIGSVRYMAPEQIVGDTVDARTDIYSLGVMMYELVTGQVPFRDSSIFKVMSAHQREAPQPPRALAPDLPPEAEAIILRAMAKPPEERFQSMEQLEEALLPLVTIPGTLGGNTTTPRLTGLSNAFPAPSSGGASRWLVPVLAFAILFVGAVIVTRWMRRSDDVDAVAKTPASSPVDAGTDRDGDGTATKASTVVVAPPPEEQYDPFADPFGAPALAGRTIRRSVGDVGQGAGGTGGLPNEEVPLEELLPPEAWTLEPGTLSGTVRNAEERPLVKASVCAWIIDPRAPVERRKRPRCTRTDRRGRFELEEVVPGLYDVHAFKNQFVPQSYGTVHEYPVALLPGSTQDGLEFTLEPGGVELRGTVKTKVGYPIVGANVAVVGGPRALAVVDDKGAFSLWVAEDTVSVVAWADGYADVVVRGAASTALDLILRTQAKILGMVVDAESNVPIANVRVRAGRIGGGISPLTYSNGDGTFTISSLSAGMYQPSGRTDHAFGQVAEAFKVREGMGSPEVIVKLRRFQVPAPPPAEVAETPVEAVGSTGGAGSGSGTGETGNPSGDTGGGGSTGGESTGAAPSVDRGAATEGVVAAAADPTTEQPIATAPDPSVAADPAPDPAAAAPASAPSKPAAPKPKPPSDKSLRRKLTAKLRKCGTNGTIEVNAKLVVASGELLQESVKVKGPAAKDKSVKQCAQKHVARFRLTTRKHPVEFEPLVVELGP